MKSKLKWKKLYIPILLIILLMIGLTWQFIMVRVERKKYPAVGAYVDVGTYQAHYYSQGTGDVAFFFITGSGTPCAYTDFYALQNMLSTIGQTVTFDHAGSGWSSNTKTPRTIENLANELSILIDAVAQNKPVILLCHSLGSLETIRYAQMNPEKVRGIIFLDSGSPEFYSNDTELLAKILNRGTAFIRTLGVNRLLGELGALLPLYGENIRNQNISKEVKNLDKAMYYQLAGNPASLSTIKLINENGKTVSQGSSLGEMPVLVLSSDSGDEWNDVQIQLASWSGNSKQVMIDNSKHYLYWSNFDEVSDYIQTFVREIIN